MAKVLIKRLYPKVKLGIGPAIESGFYYDFDLDTSITLQDLTQIEKTMHILKSNVKPKYCFVLFISFWLIRLVILGNNAVLIETIIIKVKDDNKVIVT